MSKTKPSAEKYSHLLKSTVFDKQLYAYMIHYLYKSGFVSVGISLAVLSGFYFLLKDIPNLNIVNLRVWGVGLLIVSVIRLVNVIDYFKSPLVREQTANRELYFTVTSFLHGACWLYFLMFVLTQTIANYHHFYLMIILISGMIAGSINTLAPSKKSFFLFTTPLIVGLIYNFIFVQQLVYMALVLSMLFLFLIGLYINSHVILKENVTARLLNEIMLKELERNNSTLVGEIIEKSKQAHLHWEMAHKDSLTGLGNRRALDVQLTMLQNKIGHSNKNALIFLDVDEFKMINDTLGHDIGDKVLVEIGQRLKNNVKQNDLVVRQGGDEFIILLREIKDKAILDTILNRLLQKLNTQYQVEQFTFDLSVSMGVYWFDLLDKENIEDIIKKADQALYKTKELGKKGYQVYDQHN